MEAAQQIDVLQVGDLEAYPAAGLARASGRPLTLSVREFGVLVALMRRAGRVVSREELTPRSGAGRCGAMTAPSTSTSTSSA
ncbi:MAG: winged helix-turn-helix domain-containing protein [Actinomycetota bacterium]|nr:winged helix-turn-helix domain-containing protein [Actinomycetota bacterium]